MGSSPLSGAAAQTASIKFRASYLPCYGLALAADVRPAFGPLALELGPIVLSPMEHVIFCLNYPNECKVREGSGEFSNEVPTSPAVRAQLLRVNANVNHAIIPDPEKKGITIKDTWKISPKTGNCNDFAVTKRHELLGMGWPSSNLLLAVVKLQSGEGHLVLIARTLDMDFLLDNLSPSILPMVNYKWVSVESPEDPKDWREAGFSGSRNASQ